MLDPIEQHPLRKQPSLADEVFAGVHVRPIGIDQMQHRTKLAQARGELGNVAAHRERIPLSDHEPIGHLLEEISETFVMLACGRVDPQERIDSGRVTWRGDAAWGERAARSLRFTM